MREKSAGKTRNVTRTRKAIDKESSIPIEAAPKCGLNDNEKKVPRVVNALIKTAR